MTYNLCFEEDRLTTISQHRKRINSLAANPNVSWEDFIFVWHSLLIEMADFLIEANTPPIKELVLMDKQINKVKKDIVKGDKKKGKKDVKKLLKMDKKIDAKVAKCGKMAKKKAR